MTDYYREISHGQFTVTGTVSPWKKVPRDDTFYEGGPGCNGVCNSSKLGDLLKDALDLQDATVDFSRYDNDGPDGIPNSGDDDGYVDFVAFVHAESGGECGNDNIWSHRWVYSGWTGSEYATNDARAGGGSIKIDDYVIMPGFACDGTTMIQIGVFAHEFGHAFGLPDLYDTDSSNGDSEGVGNWCLMASGSWGGDGGSPETPSHMCAWAKAFLGWVTPTEVTTDLIPATIPNIEENPIVYKVPISSTQYHLISNRQKKGFDAKLPGAGLLIWHINETAISSGLSNNRVNADENNKGVDLEEADCRNDLDHALNRADGGDPYPGTTNNRYFDNSTCPSSAGLTAVCNISDSASSMTAGLFVSMGRCPSRSEIALSLQPDKRLEYHDTTIVIAKVTLNGVPQMGKTVIFKSANPNLASILPPTSVITDSAGEAKAKIQGESHSTNTTTVTGEVDGTTKGIIVRVPDLSIFGLAFLVICAILTELARRRIAPSKK
jgi:M6 family metalloprotease-like protein